MKRILTLIKSRLSTLFILLIALASVDSRASIIAGPITYQGNGHSYFLLSVTNWTAAESEAVQLLGHLATINDKAENDWVLNTFGNFGGTARWLMIGYTDAGHEGVWTWVNGETTSYTNWNTGEPNNGAGWSPYVPEDYGCIYGPNVDSVGLWNDINASHKFNGVVEVAPEVLRIRVSQVELSWASLSNVIYQVQSRTSEPGSVWTNVGSPITGTGLPIRITESVPETGALLYRLVKSQ